MSLLLSLCVEFAAAEQRYALVIGSNQGDAADPLLSFAEEDARRVAQVLQDLGQVSPDAVVTLYRPDANRLRDTLEHLAERVARGPAEEEVVLFVYYSGHADATDLHLAGSHLPLVELRERVLAVNARARVLVVDACRAGELTRFKGARPAEPFTIIAAAPSSTQGLAIMTSAAVGEDAQESDRLRGGVFTHHLLAGLRGAADASADGRVTLLESYQYAYTQTVATTSVAPELQHPSFSLDLRGHDDLVLTRLDQAGPSGLLSFTEGGDYLIFEPRGERLVVEAFVAPGGNLALPPGDYLVRRRSSAHLYEGTVSLPPGASVGVPVLREVSFGRATRRGGRRSSAVALRAGAGLKGPYFQELPTGPHVQLGLRVDTAPLTLLLRGVGDRSSGENDALSMVSTTLGMEVGAFKMLDVGPFSAGFGLLAGGAWVHQSFSTLGVAPARDAAIGWVGMGARADWAFAPRFTLGLEGGVDAALLPLQDPDDPSIVRFQPRVIPYVALDLAVWF
ncbi:MAG TPA: caspase family protein [Myxococcota bacterium]|nr:caspase family protein [Myxococcota bacterium]HND28696.1 caspase family protein [Myxococcota bacterium]